MLYLVATPIGNLKDITFRAIEILKDADFIIAENPRTSLKLLNHYEIPKKEIIQFAEHNEHKILESLITKLKQNNGALITDAGTPGISDPGFRLARAAVEAGIKIVSIPGPSAAITALTTSGLPTDRYLFLGFLPKTEIKVIKTLTLAKDTESTGVFFDSPQRIKKTLGFIAKAFPNAKIVVTRELTKVHEEILRGTSQEVLNQLETKPTIKGEITGLISFK